MRVGVDLDAEDRRPRECPGQRLRSPHAAEPGGEDRPAGEIGRPEMLFPCRCERLVRPLKDSLRADVDPAAGGHLPEHRQAQRLEPAKLVPGRPARHEQRVRDQDARRARVRTENADRFPALHEQRLILAERQQRAHDRAQGVGVPSGLARPAVDDQLLRPLGDLRIEVVEEHPQRRLRRPRAGVQLRAARGADRREIAAEPLDRRLERAGRAHDSGSCRSRARSWYHVQATAAMNAPAATSSPHQMFPPVVHDDDHQGHREGAVDENRVTVRPH